MNDHQKHILYKNSFFLVYSSNTIFVPISDDHRTEIWSLPPRKKYGILKEMIYRIICFINYNNLPLYKKCNIQFYWLFVEFVF